MHTAYLPIFYPSIGSDYNPFAKPGFTILPHMVPTYLPGSIIISAGIPLLNLITVSSCMLLA